VPREQPHTEAKLEEIFAHYRERRLNPESFKKDGTPRKRKAAPRAHPAQIDLEEAIERSTSHAERGWPSNEAAPDAASVICSTVKPCAIMMASVQPSRLPASNSSAGGGCRKECACGSAWASTSVRALC
jgi:hypothetical protein